MVFDFITKPKFFNILLNFDDFSALEGAKIIKIQQNNENLRFIHVKCKYAFGFDNLKTIQVNLHRYVFEIQYG